MKRMSLAKLSSSCLLLCAVVLIMLTATGAEAAPPKPTPAPKLRPAPHRPHHHSHHVRPQKRHGVRVHGRRIGPAIRRVPSPIPAPLITAAPVAGNPVAGPDLAVIDIERSAAGTAEPQIVTATLRNIGSQPFDAPGGRSMFELYQDGQLMGQRPLSSLAAGHEVSLSAVARSTNRGQFEARIVHIDATGQTVSWTDLDAGNDVLRLSL